MQTEEEYLRIIRLWWSKYAVTAIGILLLALASYISWQYWQDNQYQYRASAAGLYEDINQVLLNDLQDMPDEEVLQLRESASSSAKKLIESYPDLLYSTYAALYLAYQHSADKQFKEAIAVLEEAMEGTDVRALDDIIRLRIARLHLALNETQAARAILTTLEGPKTIGLAAEIRGDSFYLEKEYTAAATSYRVALSQIEGGPAATYLNWKLQSLTEDEPVDPPLPDPAPAEIPIPENDLTPVEPPNENP